MNLRLYSLKKYFKRKNKILKIKNITIHEILDSFIITFLMGE